MKKKPQRGGSTSHSKHLLAFLEAVHHAVVETRYLVSAHLEQPYNAADWNRLQDLVRYEVQAGTALTALKKANKVLSEPEQ